MEPRAVADALETGEEDTVTEALRSFNQEVRGTQLPRKFHGEGKQRCARNWARVCVPVWREHGAGWWAGPRVLLWWAVVEQVYGRRGGSCLMFRTMAAASEVGADLSL